jgi:hypothetical protein
MSNKLAENADSIAATVETLKRHIADYGNNTPNNDLTHVRLARREIKVLREKIEKLDTMLNGHLIAP